MLVDGPPTCAFGLPCRCARPATLTADASRGAPGVTLAAPAASVMSRRRPAGEPRNRHAKAMTGTTPYMVTTSLRSPPFCARVRLLLELTPHHGGTRGFLCCELLGPYERSLG